MIELKIKIFKGLFVIVLLIVFFSNKLVANNPLTINPCLTPTLHIKSGWNYNTNTYLPHGSPDPYWFVIQDQNATTTEPRPGIVDLSGGGGSNGILGCVNSGSLTAGVNNHACASYSNSCAATSVGPCISFPFGQQGTTFDAPIIFNYSFCITPNTNLNALILNFGIKADDFGKVCLNGNFIGNNLISAPCVIDGYSYNSCYTITNPAFFNIGTNVISISLYNLGAGPTYYKFDGILSSSDPNASPFLKPNCCTPNGIITGQKFLDVNADGLQGITEPTIPNWTINLKNSSNVIISTTQTDAYGNYFFSGLTPATYIVSEGLSPTFSQTFPSFLNYTLNLITNPISLGINFGNVVFPPCNNSNFSFPNFGCIGPVSFTAGLCPNPNATYSWNFGNGSTGTGTLVSTIYNNPGTYSVTLVVNSPSQNVPSTVTQVITINPCQPPQACQNCIGSFAPDPGEYMLNIWVREDINPQPATYNNARVEISFTGDPLVHNFGTNPLKNKVIEGWQRIEEQFTIPINATFLNLKLINTGGPGAPDAFFDDVRIFPKDGQMKTYVYDPLSMRLTAVLDENNYATFYEYDEEGKLIRIKKETEKGIMTIQESREGLKKQ